MRQVSRTLMTTDDGLLRADKEECLGRVIPLGERHFRRAA
jgi:hypothetical protein